jgi:hypothetical protein
MTESIVGPVKLTGALRLAGRALVPDDSAYASVYNAKDPLWRGLTILLVMRHTGWPIPGWRARNTKQ